MTIGLVACLAPGCMRERRAVPEAEPDPLAPLRAFEAERRAATRFLDLPPSDAAFGPDPYDVAMLHGTAGFAGLLRGDAAVVLLDRGLGEVARVPTPRAPSALDVYEGAPRGALAPGDVLVTSELEGIVAHYRARGASLDRLADIPLEGVRAARDVATGPEGVIYVVEEHDDRLVSLRARPDGGFDRRERRLPAGPLRVVRTNDTLFVASLVDHTIVALPTDHDGFAGEPTARVSSDGPFWGFDAIDVDGGTLVVAGGVEDRPLDRTGGFFGFVDSFLYVWFRASGAKELAPVATINVSEQGLVVPKAIAFDRPRVRRDRSTLRAVAAGYGSKELVRLAWPNGPSAPPSLDVVSAVPGTSAIVFGNGEIVAASPLLDAWVKIDPAGPLRVVRVSRSVRARGDREKLGEALFFTGLMAPANRSDGASSRFTCETCHFEGYVDGRTHHTGRGDVRATTKPLLGLFNNRPHFTRALDPDLSSVAENEFRVAGAHSGTDPHFTIDVDRTPWLAYLDLEARSFDADEQRRALMTFLMAFTHRTNPSVGSRRAFSAVERAGAEAFRDTCERCHQARASADDPRSRVPFERWESLVMSDAGPLVWASDAYEKTGVVPYVHESGARVTSLRRVYKKRPYFTNGAAKDLAAVLARARNTARGFTHDGSTEGVAMDADTARALLAFVDLL